MQNDRILVLGATGHVGSPLVEELSRGGFAVRAAVRKPPQNQRPVASKPQVETVAFDYFNEATYAPALDGVTRLYLLTPVIEKPAEVVSKLMQAAKKAGVKRVVRQSAYGADTRDSARLLQGHLEAEKMIQKQGQDSQIEWTILRPTGFFQNFISYVEEISGAGVFHLPMGSDRSSYIDARDVARAAATCLTTSGHEGKIYNLTGPQALSNEDIADTLSDITGDQIKFVPISEEVARRRLLEDGTPTWLTEGLIELHRFWRQEKAVDVLHTVRDLTGRDGIRFSEFAREFVTVFRRRSVA